MKQSYYEILEINYNSSKEEIVARFKELLKETNQDIVCEVNKAKIIEAYETLSVDYKRSSYDSNLSEEDKRRIEENFQLYSYAIKMFNKLKENVGNKVEVTFLDGRVELLCGKLVRVLSLEESIFPRISLDFGGYSRGLPFIGNDCAIYTIIGQNEEGQNQELLFYNSRLNFNPITDRNYKLSNHFKSISELQTLTWGHSIVQKRTEVVLENKKIVNDDKREEKDKAEIKTNLPIFIEEGSKYVKPELVNEWKHLLDGYDVENYIEYLAYEAIVIIMKELSNSVDFSNLNNVIDKIDIMGYYPWHVADVIEKFHQKGKEFKLFLDKSFEEREIEYSKIK